MAEQYKGVKFSVSLSEGTPVNDIRLEELRYWCARFHEKNLTPPYPGGSYGNLSFREKKGENIFIITGTSIGLKDQLGDDCFVRVTSCDMKKRLIRADGKREPSSESMLHYSIYNARPDVQAVFHGHAAEFLKSPNRQGFLVTLTAEPYGSIELANSVLDILGYGNFLIMKGHGFISAGNSMKDAGERCIALLDGHYNSI